MPDLWELRPHLSHSSLRKFRRCPEQFRRDYLLDMKGRPNVNLLVGRAVHAAVASDLQARIEGQELGYEGLRLSAQDQWLKDTEEAEEQGGVDFGREERLLTTPTDRKTWSVKCMEQAITLASLYQGSVAPRLRPVAIEEEFSLELAGCPVPIKGFIDIREEHGIRELKTAVRSKSTMPGDWYVQGRIYQLVQPVPMRWDVLLKQAQPKVQEAVLELQPREELHEATRRMILMTVANIEHYWERYGLEGPWPDAVDNEWACNYCNHLPAKGGDCYFHKG